jgi:hypothetical protein
MTIYTGERGCGRMKSDSLYHHWSLSPGGIPISSLLLDPPWVFSQDTLDRLGISSIGIYLLPRMNSEGERIIGKNGQPIYDIFDIVGQEHYPYTSDFYVELCKHGASRKLAKNTQLSLLSTESVHFLLHAKASINMENTQMLEFWHVVSEDLPCLTFQQAHNFPTAEWLQASPEMCNRLWFHSIAEKDLVKSENVCVRNFMEHSYRVLPAIVQPEWQAAAFMYLPMGKFVATSQHDGTFSKEIMDALNKLPADMQRLVVPINLQEPNEKDDTSNI